MINEIIVHVGMHKTGSSSIQETLSKTPMEDVEYLSLGSSNHSGFFSTLLSKHPENYHAHRKNGLNKSQARELQKSYVEKLHAVLQGVTKNKVLISAEDLSSSGNEYCELEYLKEMLLPHCSRIRLIGYVRPPAGYMQSAFQQRMKGGGQNFFDLEKVYPYYKQSFAKMDAIFGKENVELIAFKRDSLHNGDVVQDFARRIGVAVEPSQIVRTNESLSLEATALLFAFRRFGRKLTGYKGYNRDNNRLIAALSGLGNQKLVFSESVLSSVFETNRSDIEWMSQRLGTSIVEEPSTSSQTIGSEEDLLDVACANRLAIWSLLEQEETLSRGGKDLAKLVDRLYMLHAREISPLLHSENSLFSSVQLELIANSNIQPELLLKTLADALTRNGQQLAAKKVQRASQRAAHLLNKV
ncbi:hypothetical protein HZS80_12020 [Halomonas glaciei]|uniref:Sulfotransferase domain-containing protein n=1 Tax=Vreelandella glaciei TaxID=186761 RepID=A0A7Z0LTQ4_9GAMM|nr:hypothetical protein [Halomonas glaciei]NYS78424.1 hypothetical protein [Halomonas glaciei]